MEKEQKEQKGQKPLNLRKCMRCGITFHYGGTGHIICPRCREADQRDFNRVRDYVYEHKGVTIIQVASELNIKPDIIEGFLRAGRLEIPNDSSIFIHCERCHREIRSGRFCAGCAAQLTAEMKKALDFDESQIGEEPVRKGKMHFVGRDNEAKNRQMTASKRQININIRQK